MLDVFYTPLILVWIFGAVFSGIAADSADRSLTYWNGFFIGLFFSPPVAVIVAYMHPTKKEKEEQAARDRLLQQQVELLAKLTEKNN